MSLASIWWLQRAGKQLLDFCVAGLHARGLGYETEADSWIVRGFGLHAGVELGGLADVVVLVEDVTEGGLVGVVLKEVRPFSDGGVIAEQEPAEEGA